MAKAFEDRLCEILIKSKIITKQEATTLHEEFLGNSKETFDTFLLSEGIIEKKDLLNALSEYYAVPSFDVSKHRFNHNLLQEFPQDVLLKHSMIPLKRDDDSLIIIASKPNNGDLLPELAEFVSDDVQFYVGITSDIQDIAMNFYDEVEPDEEDVDEEEDLYEDDDYLDDMFNDEEDEEELFF